MRRRSVIRLVALVAVAALALPGCGGASPDETAPGLSTPVGTPEERAPDPPEVAEPAQSTVPQPASATAEPASAGATGEDAPDGDSYIAGVEQFRRDREIRLAGPYGWASLIGLFWLEPGESTFGSDPGGAIVLPDDAAPPLAGRFVYNGSSVRLIAEAGVSMTIGDDPVLDRQLADDTTGRPDVVGLGRLQLIVLRRGDRHGVRVKDPESPARKSFAGLSHFPIDPAWRIEGVLRRGEPVEVEVASVIGTPHKMFSPGEVEFTLDGKTLTLQALASEPEATQLFMIFRDQTSGAESYEAGRYLNAPLDGDRVTLDFNLAYNPPCVFTKFATCPLPPPGNRLSVPVRAGEKNYHSE